MNVIDMVIRWVGSVQQHFDQNPKLVLALVAIGVAYIFRGMLTSFTRRDAQRTNTLIVGFGTLSRILHDVGRVSMKVYSIVPRPSLNAVTGILSGSKMATMPIITSSEDAGGRGKSWIRHTSPIHPRVDGRPVRTGVVDANRLYPHLIEAEARDFFHDKIKHLVPFADTVITLGSVEGGTSGAFYTANIPRNIRDIVAANNLIAISIETVPVSDEIRRGNIQLNSLHYYESAFGTADLNILIQQYMYEKQEINEQLAPFINLIGGVESQGDDAENIIERMGPAWCMIVDLGELPANGLRIQERILEVWKPVEDRMPSSIRKRMLTRTIGVPDEVDGFLGPAINGKKISLLMFQPKDMRLLNDACIAVQGITQTNLVASKAVEWRRSLCRVFLLVSLNEAEVRQSYMGSTFPEGFNDVRRERPQPLPVRGPNLDNLNQPRYVQQTIN